MFVTNWISPTKIQKISEITNFFRHYFLSRTEVVNVHSFNTAKKDQLFADALTNGDVFIPDGVSVVKACKWIKAKSQPKERIAGWDLFSFEMNKLKKKWYGDVHG